MSSRYLIGALAALALTCSGCVVPPVAVAPPPAPTAANCHEFQQTVIIAGAATEASGTTCQQPDGRWKLVASPTSGAVPPIANGDPPPAAAPPVVAAAPTYPAYDPYPYSYYYPPYYPAYDYGPPFFGAVIGRRHWH